MRRGDVAFFSKNGKVIAYSTVATSDYLAFMNLCFPYYTIEQLKELLINEEKVLVDYDAIEVLISRSKKSPASLGGGGCHTNILKRGTPK